MSSALESPVPWLPPSLPARWILTALASFRKAAVSGSHGRWRTRCIHSRAMTVFIVTPSLYFSTSVPTQSILSRRSARDSPAPIADFGTRPRSLPRQAGYGEISLTSIQVVLGFTLGTLLIVEVLPYSGTLHSHGIRPTAALVPTLTRPNWGMSAYRPSLRRLHLSRVFLIVPDVLHPVTIWMTSSQQVR